MLTPPCAKYLGRDEPCQGLGSANYGPAGKVLEPDSAQMSAMEAYIVAQRKGKELTYGKR
jgi:hypothetical protein